MLLDSAGDPVVSYWESTGLLDASVVVKKWGATSQAWAAMAIDGSGRILDAKFPLLSVDRDGNQFLAYSASSGRRPTVVRWDAVADIWQQSGGMLSSQAYADAAPSLALISDGVPVMAWAQDGASSPLTYDLMIKILNL
jgi:hypothetical protein